jgi:hypothetical protein
MATSNKKISLRIFVIAIPVFIVVAFLASYFGEKSVADLNQYGVYSFIASENEDNGPTKSRVEYYVCNGEFDIASLAELCKKKKNLYKNSMDFAGYYMVVFSGKDNVAKSKYPISSMYGDELEKLKHIKAFYTFGGFRGVAFSQIKYYDNNAAESVGKTFDVK